MLRDGWELTCQMMGDGPFGQLAQHRPKHQSNVRAWDIGRSRCFDVTGTQVLREVMGRETKSEWKSWTRSGVPVPCFHPVQSQGREVRQQQPTAFICGVIYSVYYMLGTL